MYGTGKSKVFKLVLSLIDKTEVTVYEPGSSILDIALKVTTAGTLFVTTKGEILNATAIVKLSTPELATDGEAVEAFVNKNREVLTQLRKFM